MNKKMLVLIFGLLVVGVVAGIIYHGTIIQASNESSQTVDKEQSGESEVTYTSSIQVPKPQEESEPTYISSIQIAKPQEQDQEVKEDSKAEKDNEKTEEAALKALAKITLEQATASALQAVPGKMLKVELENEEGNLIYSVEIKTTTGIVEVIVDAGNAKVLAKENADQEDQEKHKEKEELKGEKKDKDNKKE